MIKVVFVKLFESLINQIFVLEPRHLQMLEKHNGKVMQINIKELLFSFFLVMRPEKIYVYSTYSDSPDASISGSLFALANQIHSNADMGKLLVQGDMELAQDFQVLIQNLEIDWEEYLSFMIGDFATNKVAKFVQQLKQATLVHKQRALEDITEYLQEEKRFFPTPEEVEDFYEEIMSLRNTIDRLEARLHRLTECQS